MIIRANCKINIGLNILRRREDGFHELESVMYPVMGLYDELSIEPLYGTDGQVEFRSEGIAIDCSDDDNLCVRAARLMQERYGCGSISIVLDKRIPFGAGLAGGSSDAVSVILAMDRLFGLELGEACLIDIAAELGSDTAFFVRNTPQLCRGRGEIMESITVDLSGLWLVMIKPDGVSVSTREAYSGVKPSTDQPSIAELINTPVEQWQGAICNGFEPHIFYAYPLLAQIKAELLSAGAVYAAMSGSGSTIYGLFRREQDAKSEQLRSYSPYIFAL